MQIIKILHYINSALFTIVAITILFRSWRAVIYKLNYFKTDRILSYLFTTHLYIQLILGSFLFSNLGIESGTNFLNSKGNVALRHWPVEHISFMIATLLVAHLGMIFIYKSETAYRKHTRTLIFYSISFFIIILSVFSILSA